MHSDTVPVGKVGAAFFVHGVRVLCVSSGFLSVVLKCFVEHNWFHLIGIICGLAIYNFTVVDLHFPLALYKKLLNVKPCLEDLKELSPTEGRYEKQDLHPVWDGKPGWDVYIGCELTASVNQCNSDLFPCQKIGSWMGWRNDLFKKTYWISST